MKKEINLVRASDKQTIQMEISAAWDDIQAFAAMYSYLQGEEYYAIGIGASMGKYAVA